MVTQARRLWPLCKCLRSEHWLPTVGRGLRRNSNSLRTSLWRYQNCIAEHEATGSAGDMPDTFFRRLGLLRVTEPVRSKVCSNCRLNTVSVWLPILQTRFSGLRTGACKGRVGVEGHSAGTKPKGTLLLLFGVSPNAAAPAGLNQSRNTNLAHVNLVVCRTLHKLPPPLSRPQFPHLSNEGVELGNLSLYPTMVEVSRWFYHRPPWGTSAASSLLL